MKSYFIPAMTALLVGCMPEEATKARMVAIEKRASDQEATANRREEALRNHVDTVIQRMDELEFDVMTKIGREEAAIVDPTTKDFSFARNEYGAFPVFFEDAQPYLDGHKVRFRIGNFTSASLLHVALILTYGARVPVRPDPSFSKEDRKKWVRQYAEKAEEYRKSRRTLEIAIDQELSAGSWNSVEVVISPSKPEELGRIEVLVRAKGLRLETKR